MVRQPAVKKKTVPPHRRPVTLWLDERATEPPPVSMRLATGEKEALREDLRQIHADDLGCGG
ncbi:hypothetical protein KL86PLE_30429 [uncultured Pleomorphomonas sp.]|uniref:Uncharacterized protein n=1 Tax=uncultured Pleomorphomonas sp. TaxID=442121 RepID=A0A212LEI2_9HYPH|nr:hypothetical protein KL86PLE_30429 [uncultured Pleomorphomonas sp.]